MGSVLGTLLTSAEHHTLAKRLLVLKYLREGKSYEEIQSELGVSSATVSNVATFKDSENLQPLFDALDIDKWAEKLLAKLRIFK